ncbi:MAG: SH3 domain-containing protein [Clostridiales bacterium]|nr:SH3 domain-containing protein [Clostridiales bacterium]
MKNIVRSIVLTILVLMLAFTSIVNAEIISSRGEGQIGYQAVVLCESLTLRQSASSSAKALRTLNYGDVIIVAKQTNGWAYVVLGDSENSPAGWVNADYIAVDPSWFHADAKTTVYAWNSTSAPKVALLDKNTTLPILKVDKDWIVVSLRGAAGFIRR